MTMTVNRRLVLLGMLIVIINGAESTLSENSTDNATVPSNNSDVRTNIKSGYEMRCIIITTGVIGACGNGFVLIVMLGTKSLRAKTMNKFISNQAFIDLVASLLVVFNYAFDDINLVPQGIPSDVFCTIWISKYLIWSLFVTSTYNLIGMTVQKYTAIFYPGCHNKVFTKTGLVIFFVFPWILGLVWDSFNAITTTMVGNDCHAYVGSSAQHAIAVIMLCIDIIIPAAIFIICYGRIVYFVYKEYRLPADDAQRFPNMVTTSRARMSAVRTLIVVAVCFCICWTPNMVYFSLHILVIPPVTYLSSEIYHFTVVLVFCNCLCNPVIYAALYRDFQHGVKLMFCKKALEGYDPDDDDDTMFHQKTVLTVEEPVSYKSQDNTSQIASSKL